MDGEKTSITPSVIDNVMKVRILVVDNDAICLAITASVLNVLNYEVVTTKCPLEALSILRMTHGSFDIVLSDIHLSLMNGLNFQRVVENEFQIPVILMSSNDKRNILVRNLENEGTIIIVKPPTVDDLKYMWEYVALRKKRFGINSFGEGVQPCNNNEMSSKTSTSIEVSSSISSTLQKRKSKNTEKRVNNNIEGNNNVPSNSKKRKMTWTPSLHKQFVDAVAVIGVNRAVPKKILEYMNVPELTRENIASHLQKYRIYSKRKKDTDDSLKYDVPQHWNGNSLRSNFSWSQTGTHDNNNISSLYHSNALNLSQQQEARTSTYNYDQLDENLSHVNSSYGGSQGISMLNSQPNTFHPSSINNLVYDTPSYNYLTRPMKSLGSLMSDGENNNKSYGNNDGDLTSAARQFMSLKPTTSFNEFERNINDGGHTRMLSNATQEGTQAFLPISSSNVNPFEMNNHATRTQVGELFGLSNAYNFNDTMFMAPSYPQLTSQEGPYFDASLDNMVNNNITRSRIRGHNYNNVENLGNMSSNFNNNMLGENLSMPNLNMISSAQQAMMNMSNVIANAQQVGMMPNLSNNYFTSDDLLGMSNMTTVPTTWPPVNTFDMNNGYTVCPSSDISNVNNISTISRSTNNVSDMNNVFSIDPPVNVTEMNNVSVVGQQDIASNIMSNESIASSLIMSSNMNNMCTIDQPMLKSNLNSITTEEVSVGNSANTTLQKDDVLDKDMSTFNFTCASAAAPQASNHLDDDFPMDYDAMEDLSAILSTIDAQNGNNN